MSETRGHDSGNQDTVVPLRSKRKQPERRDEQITAEYRENNFRAHKAYAVYVGECLYHLDTLIVCAKERQARADSPTNTRRMRALLDMSSDLSTALQEKFANLTELYMGLVEQNRSGDGNDDI